MTTQNDLSDLLNIYSKIQKDERHLILTLKDFA